MSADFGRVLSPEESRAWGLSSAFRQAVKGGLVAKALDESDARVAALTIRGEVATVLGRSVLVLWREDFDTEDTAAEFWDADVNECGAREREILESLNARP